jgi:hypothetical protein
LGIDIDIDTCYCFAPVEKLQKLAKQARHLLQRSSTRNNRWLPVKELQSFASHAQYLFSCYPGGKILRARTPLRTWRQVGRPRPPHPAAPSRSIVYRRCKGD